MIEKLKIYVHKVIPLVYDDSLSYYEVLGKVVEKCNECIEQTNENTDSIEALEVRVGVNEGDIDTLKKQINMQLTSAMSIAINELQDDVESLTGRVDSAELDIDTLQNDVQDCETDIEHLENRMDDAEGDIESLERIAPSPNAQDVGKILTASSIGEGQWSDAPIGVPEYDSGDEYKFLTVAAQGGDISWSTGHVYNFNDSVRPNNQADVTDWSCMALKYGKVVDIRCSGVIAASDGVLTINVNKNIPYTVSGADPILIPTVWDTNSGGFLYAECARTDEYKMTIEISGTQGHGFILSTSYISEI